MKLCSGAALAAVVASAADVRDLQRARAKVPRQGWKGNTPHDLGETLNGHMTKMFPRTKPCEEWTTAELQDFQAQLHSHREPEFDTIYAATSDNRRLLHDSLEKYKQQWSKTNGLVRQNQHLKDMHRDGHCHEAVMWLIHHTPAADQQTVFARQHVPLLPHKVHTCAQNATQSELEVCKVYEGMRSCGECHSNSGMIMQDWSDPDGYIPEDPKLPGYSRQRRCDQNYVPKCGPCDGIGGPYWGDELSKFQPTHCSLVANPEDVNESDRVKPEFAESFIVHQLGSDRLSRTQNAANFAFYSQIRSTLWYDFPLGGESAGIAPDGMAKLRHDSFYDDMAYRWLGNGLVTEIHLQNRAQREANVTGPMVSLLHGLLGWGKYMGGLTCLADPVGVPVMGGAVDVNGVPHSAFLEGADYKGRIKIGVEYAGYKMGDDGHGDMKAKKDMIVDHYAKWFLHVFMDADKNSPTYGQPVRFYGPYSGFAVYITFDKVKPPASTWTTACVGKANGWNQPSKPESCLGKNITDYPCMVVGANTEVCAPWASGSTGVDANVPEFETYRGSFGTLRFPKTDDLPTYV